MSSCATMASDHVAAPDAAAPQAAQEPETLKHSRAKSQEMHWMSDDDSEFFKPVRRPWTWDNSSECFQQQGRMYQFLLDSWEANLKDPIDCWPTISYGKTLPFDDNTRHYVMVWGK